MPIPDTAFHDVSIAVFLASELRLAGAFVLIVERADYPDTPLKTLPFGHRDLSVPTIESLDQHDLLDNLNVQRGPDIETSTF